MQWTIEAPAKINIGLDIYKLKQGEHKHRIKSIFALAYEYIDKITIIESATPKVKYLMNKRNDFFENDIVMKTLYFMEKNFSIPINYEIIIEKHIPIGAGLGGSSADSGAIIKFLVRKEKLTINKHMMKKIALDLGSDIPFFISDCQIALVSKFGDKIESINKPIPYFKIYPNNFSCDTTRIYAAFDKGFKQQPKNNFKQIIKSLPHLNECNIINHLQKIVLKINPLLTNHIQDGWVMTGSGSYFLSFKGE